MKTLLITVPDDWKDHHAVDWEWMKANAKEAVEVEQSDTFMMVTIGKENKRPVTLYAVKKEE